MENGGPEQDPFDERAALAELERLREQIKRHRAERKTVEEEFGRFIESFKPPVSVAPVAHVTRVETPAPAVVPSAPPVAPVTPVEIPAPPAIALAPPPPFAEPLDATPAIADEATPDEVARGVDMYSSPGDALATIAKPAPPVRKTGVWLVAALILVAGGALVLWMLQQGDVTPPAASPVPQTTATPPPLEPAPVPAPVAPPALQESVITTVRPVWMRVVVDGERVLEREVAADTRVPMAPGTTVVIRTGDAGAVRVTIAGEDQGFLGGQGEVVTRTFTIPAAPAR